MVDRDASDMVDDTAPIGDASFAELFKRGSRGSNSVIDIVEESKSSHRRTGRSSRGRRCTLHRLLASHFAENLFHDGANESFVYLHGCFETFLLTFVYVVFFDVDGIDDADDDAVDRKFAGFGSESCAAALRDEDHVADPCT